MQQTNDTFSMTGFDDKIQSQIISQLFKLGFGYEKNLSLTTKILVVNSTATEKFKIAKLKKTPTPCVNKKWVDDSVAKNYPQPYDKYMIKEIFFCVCVGVCGFNEQKVRKIEKIICENGGSIVKKYSATDIIRKYDEIPQKPDVIIGTQDEIQRAKHAKLPHKDEHIVPLVRLEWLDHSLNRKRCKYPKDYAVNLLSEKPVISNKKRLEKILKTFLQTYDIMELKNQYLQDTLIYIDFDIPGEFGRLLKNALAICGGYWTEKFTSIVTHVLVMQIDEGKYKDFKKYGNRIYIVKCQWLVDSILLYNRMDEQDYLVRSFKISDQQYRTLALLDLARMDENSQNINSVSVFPDRRLTMNSNTFTMQTQLQKKKNTQLKSNIFQNHSFYFPSDIVMDSAYNDMISSIKKAGGLSYNKVSSRMHVYVPLRDSPVVATIKEKLIVSKSKAIIVSERWIKECIKKNQFIEFEPKKYPHFKAFDFVTPLSEFHRYIFDLVGFPSEISPRIRDLLSVFGSTKMNPNKSQVTHILCGPYWKDEIYQDKIKKIQAQLDRMNKRGQKKELTTVPLIRFEWLDQCEKEKKLASIEGYVIEVLETSFPQTPQKKMQDNNSGSQNKNTQAEKSETKLTP